MARVTILSLTFPPDGVSTALIMGQLALDLQCAGHSVNVITTSPHYNRDAVAEESQPLTRKWGGLFYRSNFHGVDVYHIRAPRRRRARTLSRLAAWLAFNVGSLIVGAALRPADVVITPSPPLTNGLCAWLLTALRGGCYIYNVQEVYPDVAVSLNLIASQRLIKLLSATELFVYRKAFAVTAITEGIRDNVLAKTGASERIRLVPNFVDVDEITPCEKLNEFAHEFGFTSDDFVVSYAGNIGPAQDLGCLLDAAALLANQPHIRFVLIGDGVDRARLAQRSAREGLSNVSFIPHQPYARVPEIYGASDLCIVPQIAGIGAQAAPSKLYRIMAAARPILAITDPSSDVALTVERAGCGAVVAPGDAPKLAGTIAHACATRSQWREKGLLGRDYVVRNYARTAVTNAYVSLVEEASRSRLLQRKHLFVRDEQRAKEPESAD